MVRKLIIGATLITSLVLAGCGSSEPESSQRADASSVTWKDHDGLSLPYSDEAGPMNSRQVARFGFEQSELGAALAAIHGQASLATAPDGQWASTLNTVTAPGQGRDQFAASRVLLSINGDTSVEHPTEFVGYRITAYDEESDPPTAAVEILMRPDGTDELYAYPTALAWLSGDWRIVLPLEEDNVDARLVAPEAHDEFIQFGGGQ